MAAPKLRAVDTVLPDPPYPPDTKSNGWKPQFDIARILVSDTWTLAEDDERPWLLRVWFECWSSVPVGSMPADRRLFSRRIGCTAAFLDAHSEILLRGWERHSDGLLYHGHVASQVNEMLGRRSSTKEKVAAWRERKKKKKESSAQDLATVTSYSEVTNRYKPVSNRQEKEKDKEKDKDKKTGEGTSPLTVDPPPPAAVETKKTRTPYQKILDLYREMLPSCEQPLGIEHWTAARKDLIRARWQNQLPDLDAWKQCFGYVAASRFLTGRATPSDGRKPFRANLFWIAKAENLLKIYEGKYDD